ncbi:MAG TPA: glycosyltransferase family 2 protein [Patescibacteria group bacterium]
MKNVSAIITTVAGEEKYLPQALASIKGLVGEIVIVDMSGESKISAVAKKYGARVFKHDLVNYVEPVRNFGISKAEEGNWLLILDPDEEVPHSLSERLKEIVNNNEADYVRIPRKNVVFGKWVTRARWWPDYNIRFFKNGKVFWNEIIHGVPTTEGRGIDLGDKEEFAIVHHHYESIEQYISRMNRYTSVQADLKAKDYKFEWKDLISKPTAEFVSRYFAGEGYKDGLHGLSLSLLQGFSELVVYLKIWQKEQFEEKKISVHEVIGAINESQSEVNYWQADALVKNEGGVINKFKRKFKLR